MKKLFIALLAMVLMVATSASALETFSSTGVGFITKKGTPSEFAYRAGFEIPILQKLESGFIFKTETTYLYSSTESETQVLRVMSTVEKTLWRGSYNEIDSTYGWRFFLGGGTGTWTFLNTEGADETYGSITTQIGIEWASVVFALSNDIVMLPGNDVFAPFFGVSFGF